MGYQYPSPLLNLSCMDLSVYSSCNSVDLWPLCITYNDFSYLLALGYLTFLSVNCLIKGDFDQQFLSYFLCLNQEICHIRTSQRPNP